MKKYLMMISVVASLAFVGCNDFKLDNGDGKHDDEKENPGGGEGENPDSGEIDNPGLVSEYDYTENGVSFGGGLKVDGVIWAPVNAGSTKADKKGSYLFFNDAKSCCPEGWRLPTEKEMKALTLNCNPDIVQHNGLSGLWCSGLEEFKYNQGNDGAESLAVPSVFLPYAGYMVSGMTVEDSGIYWAEGESGTGMICDLNNRGTFNVDDGLSMFTSRCVHEDSELVIPTMTMDGTVFIVSTGGGSSGKYVNFEYPDGRDAQKGLLPALKATSNSSWCYVSTEFDKNGKFCVNVRASANPMSSTREAVITITFFDQTITGKAMQYPKQ